MQSQKEGFILVSVMLLSVVMLGAGLFLASIVGSQTKTVSAAFQGESAYFAAESGVEIAAQLLKAEPTNHIENHKISFAQALDTSAANIQELTINVDNKSNDFNINLAGTEVAKFSLKLDDKTDDTFNAENPSLENIKITNVDRVKFLWRIACKDSSGDSISFENTSSQALVKLTTVSDGKLISKSGATDTKSLIDLKSAISTSNTCHLSIQNLNSAPELKTFNITSSSTKIPPYITNINVTGQTGQIKGDTNPVTKTINFSKKQNDIPSILNFGIYQID